MNTEEMTDYEKNMAIAKACGWKAVRNDWRIANRVHVNPTHPLIGISPIVQTMDHGEDESKEYNYWIIPNYVYDLNSMREAESTLNPPRRYSDRKYDDPRWIAYENALALISTMGAWIHASAQERSEAFLRTLP